MVNAAGRAARLTLLLVAAGGCGGKSPTATPSPPPPLTFGVDPTVTPLAPTVPGLNPGDPPRPVAAVEDGRGNRVEFIANEMLVVAASRAAADAVATRWNGTVVTEVVLGVIAPGAASSVFLLRVDTTRARPQELPGWARQVDPGSRGVHAVSSSAGLNLLAAIGEEVAVNGLVASANPLMTGSSIASRSTTEAPVALGDGALSYSPDAFTWAQMSRGPPQDLGVAEAWRMLSDAGRLRNRVKIMVMDGGFSRNADLAGARMYPGWGWENPNPASCTAGTPCPWHGTGVAQIAGGLVDNGFGAAGTAGPVADLMLVSSPSPDFMSYLIYAGAGIAAALFDSPDIINISASARIPAGLYLLTFGALDATTAIITGAGTVIVAAAGNDGANIDAEDCAWFVCWEEAVFAPCELSGVVCVGGLGFESIGKDAGTNYGLYDGGGSIDIFGPYHNWVGPEPKVVPADNVARLIRGTSGAAPFVSGVIALTKAANPARSMGQARDTVLATAHLGSSRVKRYVDAYAAVHSALGGNAPPYLAILTPTEGQSFARRSASVPLSAQVTDDDGDAVTVSWTSDRDGALGSGASLATTSLSLGTHLLTASTTDGVFPVSRSVSVTITNTAPQVSIADPLTPTAFGYVGEPLTLRGTSYDPNDLAALSDAQVSWRLGTVDAAPFATGHLASITFATTGLRTIHFVGTDGLLSSSDSLSFSVLAAPTNLPPTPTILTPPGPVYSPGYATTSDASGYYTLVNFTGKGTDPEDGTLTGTSLRWYTMGTGSWLEIGTGTSGSHKFYVPAGASQATHALMLQATDSAGNVRSVSISVVISQFI